MWRVHFLLNVARLKLSGDAHSYFESVDAPRYASTFDNLAHGFSERYSDKRGVSHYRDRLSTLQQKPNEGFEVLADRIRAVPCHTYTLRADATRNKVSIEEAEARGIDVFIRGISPQIGSEVKVASPTSLQEAVQIALPRVEAGRFVVMNCTTCF